MKKDNSKYNHLELFGFLSKQNSAIIIPEISESESKSREKENLTEMTDAL